VRSSPGGLADVAKPASHARRLRPVLLLSLPLLAAAFAAMSATARADCPGEEAVDARAQAYLARRSVAGYGDALSLDDAYCAQAKLVTVLSTGYGSVVGYKVAFTSEAVQERFGVKAPATGLLLEKMILTDGATVTPEAGYPAFIEPDMLVTVKDDGIMSATSELEVAQHLGELRPFLELPAQPFEPDVKLDGPTLVAFNTTAHLGVVGKGVPVKATKEFVDAMAGLETEFTDETGTLLQSAPAGILMGHPLKVVLWLIGELKRRGEVLKGGQAISLGTLGKLFPLEARDKTYTLTYRGLPGDPVSVSVTVK